MSDDTLLLTYDSSHTDYEGLLDAIKSKTHGKIDHLALANHGGEGFFNLFDGATVSLAALTANDGQNAMVSFWKDLSALMSEDGRIDLLACRVTADNQILIDHLEELSGVNFAASSNSTGLGGDWLLETDNVEVSSLYFNEAELLNWQGDLFGGGIHWPASNSLVFWDELEEEDELVGFGEGLPFPGTGNGWYWDVEEGQEEEQVGANRPPWWVRHYDVEESNDSDGDGLDDDWELSYASNLEVLGFYRYSDSFDESNYTGYGAKIVNDELLFQEYSSYQVPFVNGSSQGFEVTFDYTLEHTITDDNPNPSGEIELSYVSPGNEVDNQNLSFYVDLWDREIRLNESSVKESIAELINPSSESARLLIPSRFESQDLSWEVSDSLGRNVYESTEDEIFSPRTPSVEDFNPAMDGANLVEFGSGGNTSYAYIDFEASGASSIVLAYSYEGDKSVHDMFLASMDTLEDNFTYEYSEINDVGIFVDNFTWNANSGVDGGYWSHAIAEKPIGDSSYLWTEVMTPVDQTMLQDGSVTAWYNGFVHQVPLPLEAGILQTLEIQDATGVGISNAGPIEFMDENNSVLSSISASELDDFSSFSYTYAEPLEFTSEISIKFKSSFSDTEWEIRDSQGETVYKSSVEGSLEPVTLADNSPYVLVISGMDGSVYGDTLEVFAADGTPVWELKTDEYTGDKIISVPFVTGIKEDVLGVDSPTIPVYSKYEQFASKSLGTLEPGIETTGTMSFTWSPGEGLSASISGLSDSVSFTNISPVAFKGGDDYSFYLSSDLGSSTSFTIDNVVITPLVQSLGDFDGDGSTDIEEFINRTNPTVQDVNLDQDNDQDGVLDNLERAQFESLDILDGKAEFFSLYQSSSESETSDGVIGEFVAFYDYSANEVFEYSLAPATEGNDNEYFQVKDNKLLAFLNESRKEDSVYTIDVILTDSQGNTLERVMRVNLSSSLEEREFESRVSIFIPQEYTDAMIVGETLWAEGRFSQYGDRVDTSEVFEDANDNGVYDEGEPFVDANGNEQFDMNSALLWVKIDDYKELGEEFYLSAIRKRATGLAIQNNESPVELNRAQLEYEDYTDANRNGLYDEGEPFVDAKGNGVFDSVNLTPYERGRYSSMVPLADGTILIDTSSYVVQYGSVANDTEAIFSYRTNTYALDFTSNTWELIHQTDAEQPKMPKLAVGLNSDGEERVYRIATVDRFYIAPSDNGVLLNQMFSYSDDGGRNWTDGVLIPYVSETEFEVLGRADIAAYENKVAIAVLNEEGASFILESLDSGDSWSRVDFAQSVPSSNKEIGSDVNNNEVADLIEKVVGQPSLMYSQEGVLSVVYEVALTDGSGAEDAGKNALYFWSKTMNTIPQKQEANGTEFFSASAGVKMYEHQDLNGENIFSELVEGYSELYGLSITSFTHTYSSDGDIYVAFSSTVDIEDSVGDRISKIHLVRSTDQGVTWSSPYVYLGDEPTSYTVADMSIDAKGDIRLQVFASDKANPNLYKDVTQVIDLSISKALFDLPEDQIQPLEIPTRLKVSVTATASSGEDVWGITKKNGDVVISSASTEGISSYEFILDAKELYILSVDDSENIQSLVVTDEDGKVLLSVTQDQLSTSGVFEKVLLVSEGADTQNEYGLSFSTKITKDFNGYQAGYQFNETSTDFKARDFGGASVLPTVMQGNTGDKSLRISDTRLHSDFEDLRGINTGIIELSFDAVSSGEDWGITFNEKEWFSYFLRSSHEVFYGISDLGAVILYDSLILFSNAAVNEEVRYTFRIDMDNSDFSVFFDGEEQSIIELGGSVSLSEFNGITFLSSGGTLDLDNIEIRHKPTDIAIAEEELSVFVYRTENLEQELELAVSVPNGIELSAPSITFKSGESKAVIGVKADSSLIDQSFSLQISSADSSKVYLLKEFYVQEYDSDEDGIQDSKEIRLHKSLDVLDGRVEELYLHASERALSMGAVAEISALDRSEIDELTYELIASSDQNDNESFEIEGSFLYAQNELIDRQKYSVSLRASDAQDNQLEETLEFIYQPNPTTLEPQKKISYLPETLKEESLIGQGLASLVFHEDNILSLNTTRYPVEGAGIYSDGSLVAKDSLNLNLIKEWRIIDGEFQEFASIYGPLLYLNNASIHTFKDGSKIVLAQASNNDESQLDAYYRTEDSNVYAQKFIFENAEVYAATLDSNDKLHLAYWDISGDRAVLKYSSSTDKGATWDTVTLDEAGLNEANLRTLAIAEKDGVVAVIDQYPNGKTILYKLSSSDNEWESTTIVDTPPALFSETEIAFYLNPELNQDGQIDTFKGVDRGVSVLIDDQGVVHVVMGSSTRSGPFAKDYRSTPLLHWSESIQNQLPGVTTVDDQSVYSFSSAQNLFTPVDFNGVPLDYESSSDQFFIGTASMPSAVVDSNGDIYVAFSAITEQSDNPRGYDREIMIMRSVDSGATWSPPLQITQASHNAISPHISIEGDTLRVIYTSVESNNYFDATNAVLKQVTFSKDIFNLPLEEYTLSEKAMNVQPALQLNVSESNPDISWDFRLEGAIVQAGTLIESAPIFLDSHSLYSFNLYNPTNDDFVGDITLVDRLGHTVFETSDLDWDDESRVSYFLETAEAPYFTAYGYGDVFPEMFAEELGIDRAAFLRGYQDDFESYTPGEFITLENLSYYILEDDTSEAQVVPGRDGSQVLDLSGGKSIEVALNEHRPLPEGKLIIQALVHPDSKGEIAFYSDRSLRDEAVVALSLSNSENVTSSERDADALIDLSSMDGNQWHELSMVVDLDNDEWKVFLNNVFVTSFRKAVEGLESLALKGVEDSVFQIDNLSIVQNRLTYDYSRGEIYSMALYSTESLSTQDLQLYTEVSQGVSPLSTYYLEPADKSQYFLEALAESTGKEVKSFLMINEYSFSAEDYRSGMDGWLVLDQFSLPNVPGVLTLTEVKERPAMTFTSQTSQQPLLAISNTDPYEPSFLEWSFIDMYIEEQATVFFWDTSGGSSIRVEIGNKTNRVLLGLEEIYQFEGSVPIQEWFTLATVQNHELETTEFFVLTDDSVYPLSQRVDNLDLSLNQRGFLSDSYYISGLSTYAALPNEITYSFEGASAIDLEVVEDVSTLYEGSDYALTFVRTKNLDAEEKYSITLPYSQLDMQVSTSLLKFAPGESTALLDVSVFEDTDPEELEMYFLLARSLSDSDDKSLFVLQFNHLDKPSFDKIEVIDLDNENQSVETIKILEGLPQEVIFKANEPAGFSLSSILIEGLDVDIAVNEKNPQGKFSLGKVEFSKEELRLQNDGNEPLYAFEFMVQPAAAEDFEHPLTVTYTYTSQDGYTTHTEQAQFKLLVERVPYLLQSTQSVISKEGKEFALSGRFETEGASSANAGAQEGKSSYERVFEAASGSLFVEPFVLVDPQSEGEPPTDSNNSSAGPEPETNKGAAEALDEAKDTSALHFFRSSLG